MDYQISIKRDGKTPADPGADQQRMRLKVIAPSQVVQELPAQDRRAWAREIVELPENSFEFRERIVRETERRFQLSHARAWAKLWLSVATVAFLVSGCGVLPPSSTDPTITTCIAEYKPLLPGIDLGQDGCGNLWVRHTANSPVPTCWFMPEPGYAVEITCPAEGETLLVHREAEVK